MIFGYLPIASDAIASPGQAAAVGPVSSTNTHFITKFKASVFNRPVQSNDQSFPAVVETNPHFTAKLAASPLQRPFLSEDRAQPPVIETNIHFLAKYATPPLKRPVQSADLSSPAVIETNVNFIGRFKPLTLNRPIQSADQTSPPVVVTNTHFIAKYVAPKLGTVKQSPIADIPFVPAQPETNTNFLARFIPASLKRPVQSADQASPPVAETNTHYVARFIPPSLRQPVQPQEFFPVPVVETNVHFIAKLIQPIFAKLFKNRHDNEAFVQPDAAYHGASRRPSYDIETLHWGFIQALPQKVFDFILETTPREQPAAVQLAPATVEPVLAKVTVAPPEPLPAPIPQDVTVTWEPLHGYARSRITQIHLDMQPVYREKRKIAAKYAKAALEHDKKLIRDYLAKKGKT